MGRCVDKLIKTKMRFVCGYPGNKGLNENQILNETILNSVLFACE